MKQSLQNIQADFQEYILQPRAEMASIERSIAEQCGLNASDRLAIYHNAYRARLHEALSEAFEKTHSYLGDDLFAQCCDDYIQANPSHTRNLRWYGDSFPAHLAQALEEHPIVAELASFEWALGLAFDADDAVVMTADDMRSLTPTQWEQIPFELHPSVHIILLQWNVIAIWLALDKEETPPEASATLLPTSWLVWRKQLQPHFRSIGGAEAFALRGLQQGRGFSSVCEDAAASIGEQDITPIIAGWLQNWLSEAVLVPV